MKRCFFNHRWKSISTDVYKLSFYSFRVGEERPTGTETLVLQKCERCGNVRTRTLEGTWKLEDLI